MDNVRGAWVKEQKVHVEDGRMIAYRVDIMVTFVLRDRTVAQDVNLVRAMIG